MGAHDSISGAEISIPSDVSADTAAFERNALIADLKRLSTRQINQRLRDLLQPIRLFGEEDEDRLKRLLDSQKLDEGRDDEYRSTIHSRGVSARKDDDRDDDDDDMKPEEKPKELATSDNNGLNSSGNQIKDHGHSKKSNGPLTFPTIAYTARADLTKEESISKYFKLLLRMWDADLESRDEVTKRSQKGRSETAVLEQCKDYIAPLLRMCRHENMPPDILINLHELVKHCEEGNFRAAHDCYIRTAIGNAAWPIGLTMVGIHERSGRERISTSKVAHVMNNEQQRKYLTSVKRLMTFAQSKRPDIPPSMKVL